MAGVKQGEWVEYSIIWKNPGSSDPYKVRREILEASGSTINVNITVWYSNGTVTKKIMTGDVSNGTGAAALMFIPANLSVGETFCIHGLNESVSIIRELEREYLGSKRIVVYSHFFGKGFDIEAYWDKVKGVALEINSEHSSLGRNKIIISDTNMFSSNNSSNSSNNSGFNWSFYLVVAISIIALLSFLMKKRRAKHKRRLIKRK